MERQFLFVLITVLYPIFLIVDHYRIKKRKTSDSSQDKIKDYQKTILVFWFLTISVVLNDYLEPIPSLSFQFELSLLNTVFMSLVILLGYVQYRNSRVNEINVTAFASKSQKVVNYLPTSRQELSWFIMVAISAGFCEEVLFRMFVYEFAIQYIGVSGSLLFTNVIFAITHIDTGMKNLVGVFILGLVFSLIFYFTQNIWIVVALHISIDFNAGVLGYRVHQFNKRMK
ncbi:CPBP family intramembrane glutamic endopeptidase [Sphingobacterium cellulitidis]|uniref:CPBP family intramembrane glutamic endopeptidase n=1 Tax=Sphingobacterium cellulitidis TaxID=1768011 RepID=UPI003C7DBA00